MARSPSDDGKQVSGTRYHTRGEEDAEEERRTAAGVKEHDKERKEAAANKGEKKRKNWRVETLSRTSFSSSSSMLMHANEKQLRGLMRLGGASPVQRRGPGSSLESDTH